MIIIWSVVQAIFVRTLLFIHSFLCIWRTVDVQKNKYFWLLGIGNILHIIELEHRILKKKGQEDKWFCPCFLIHLINTIPAIWLLEFDRLQRQQTTIDVSIANISNATLQTDKNEQLSDIDGITLPVKLDADTWASVLEQGFLFILILGRWILPRGKLSRDQLSQLLFVYIGSGSDVMELFIIFEEPEIRSDKTFSFAILAVWSISLLQFTLVLTSTRKKRGGYTATIEYHDESELPGSPPRCCAKMVEMEIWSLFVAMVLQDGPYLTIRLCAIFVKGVLSYGIIFFASKNVLMLLMLVYRCLVVTNHNAEADDKSKGTDEENNSNNQPKEKNIKSNEKREKHSQRHRRWFSESPPNYWSHQAFFYPRDYGFGQANYGYY